MDNDIVVLKQSLTFLSWGLMFPKKNDIKNPGKRFYFKIILLMLSTVGPALGVLLHFIKNIIDETYIQIDLDIGIMVSFIGCLYFNFCYLKNVKNSIQLYKRMSDFKSYGKPPLFEQRNRRLNKLSIIHYSYITVAVAGITVAPILETHQCELENIRKNLDEICGFNGRAWWPFDIRSYPYKQIYQCYQIYSGCVIYINASAVSFSVMETVEHLIIRLRHVREVFEEALSEQNKTKRQEKFGKAVDYHVAVTEISKMMNKSFVPCMFLHVLLTGGILGCLGYRMSEVFSLAIFCLYLGWVVSMCMVSFSGQRLIAESTAVGDAVYNFSWYELDVSLQKDIIPVIIRSQKPLYLEAGPFGCMTYPLMVTVFKTSYSYLALLNRTNQK